MAFVPLWGRKVSDGLYHITLNSTCFKSPTRAALFYTMVRSAASSRLLHLLSPSQKIIIEGKKYSWCVHHMAKIPHSLSAHHPIATPASKVTALPLASTQTVRSSRSRRRGDRLLNVRIAVSFARPNRFTSSATAVTFASEKVNQLQVNPPALGAVYLSNQCTDSSQENAGTRVSKWSP